MIKHAIAVLKDGTNILGNVDDYRREGLSFTRAIRLEHVSLVGDLGSRLDSITIEDVAWDSNEIFFGGCPVPGMMHIPAESILYWFECHKDWTERMNELEARTKRKLKVDR